MIAALPWFHSSSFQSAAMDNKPEKFSFEEKGVLQNHKLYAYLLETSVYPREPEILKELREASSTYPMAEMGTNPDTGRFMSLLLKLVNAKNTIELGVFTGYSLLLTALALPDDGKVVGIDIDRKAYDDVGSQIVKKSGVGHKIHFVESPALPFLDSLLADASNEGSFDFAFVDADKANYKSYHEKLLRLIKVGGLILYDNTLWGGSVILSDVQDVTPEYRRPTWKDTIDFNLVLGADPRLDVSMIPLGDGVAVCRRLY